MGLSQNACSLQPQGIQPHIAPRLPRQPPCQLGACFLRLLLFSPGPLVFPAGLTWHIAGHGSGGRAGRCRAASCCRPDRGFGDGQPCPDSSHPSQAADEVQSAGGRTGEGRVSRQLAGVASHSRFRAALLLSDWCLSRCRSPNVRRPGRLVSAAKGPHVSNSPRRGFAQREADWRHGPGGSLPPLANSAARPILFRPLLASRVSGPILTAVPVGAEMPGWGLSCEARSMARAGCELEKC